MSLYIPGKHFGIAMCVKVLQMETLIIIVFPINLMKRKIVRVHFKINLYIHLK